MPSCSRREGEEEVPLKRLAQSLPVQQLEGIGAVQSMECQRVFELPPLVDDMPMLIVDVLISRAEGIPVFPRVLSSAFTAMFT